MNVVDGDMNVKGNIIITGGTIALPANTIGNDQISSASPLDVSKSTQQIVEKYVQLHGTAAQTVRVPFHLAVGAGVVNSVQAGIVVAAVGAATVTVDLYRGGASISTPISIDSGDAAFALLPMIVDVNEDDYLEDAVFELVVTATAGGGTLPQGLFVVGVFRETAQA